MTTELSSLLDKALDNWGESVVDVPVQSVHSVLFSQLKGIGTRGLGSCSVVLIVSGTCAILAHIPPRPDGADPEDLLAGDRNAEDMMKEVARIFEKHYSEKHFPTNSQSWCVCAVLHHGQSAVLEDQRDIIHRYLLEMSLKVNDMTYVVGAAIQNYPGRGTVFVDASNGTPQVYIEDKLVWAGPGSQPLTPTSRSEPSTTTSGPTAPVPSSSRIFHGHRPNLWDEKRAREYVVEESGNLVYVGPQYYLDANSRKYYFVNEQGLPEWKKDGPSSTAQIAEPILQIDPNIYILLLF